MNELAKNRYLIIKPFLDREKTLRQIQQEEDVSYATLKRWVKAYKENGIEGLETKQREDRNSFRKAGQSTLDTIETVYSENKEKPLWNLYEMVKEKIEDNISFNTFYRIVSNLDGYLRSKTKFQVSRNVADGEVYVVKSFLAYHFIKDDTGTKLPFILLAFHIPTLDFIASHICFAKKCDENVSAFLREVILKGANIYQVKALPKEILIDGSFSLNKSKKEQILEETNIKLLEFDASYDEIERFIEYLKIDLDKVFAKETTYEELKDFLENYAKYYTSSQKCLLSKEQIQKLDCFLPHYKRKVHYYGVRVNHTYYNSKILQQYIGEVVEIIHYPFEQGKVAIWFQGRQIDVILEEKGEK